MKIVKNGFSSIPKRLTKKVIFLLHRLMEKYKEKREDFQMVFIDLERANNSPREVLWWI